MYENREYILNDGERCRIISVKGKGKVVVEFLGYEGESHEVYKENLVKGKVKNPFKPTVSGVGVIGNGEYNTKTSINGVNIYRLWVRMIQRSCYNKTQERSPSYKGCSVDEVFTKYQEFAKWCFSQEFILKSYQLDKDLLVRGNKIYSPKTCCFLPRELNDLLSYRKAVNSNCLIGVTDNGKGRYVAKIMTNSEQRYLGTFNTPEEAFYAYKEAKEDYIKEVANKYKDRIDIRAYEALMKYEVNIDD